jgi:ABC-type polysaccharide/polyol phosphate export permease
MLIDAYILLTTNKIKSHISFSIDTFTTLLQPILWLSIFLFLRESNTFLEIGNNDVRYVDFLVLGIFLWRIVSSIIGRFSSIVKEDMRTMRSVMITNGGKKVLMWSGITATLMLALIVGGIIILYSIFIYDFEILPNFLPYALLVFMLMIIIHFEIAIIVFILNIQKKSLNNLGFILTTLFALLSGVFFPVDLYPYPLNDISYAFPLTQSLSLMRELLLYQDVSINWNMLLLITLESIFLFILSFVLYKKKLNTLFK